MDTKRLYYDRNDNLRSIDQMVKEEPQWAASRIQVGEDALERIERAKEAMKKHIKWKCASCRVVLDILDGLK